MIHKIGTTLSPKPQPDGFVRMGCAIIIGTPPTHKGILARPEMYGLTEQDWQDGISYEIITDFGNRAILLPNELRDSFEIGRVDDIKERLERQLELLQDYHKELVMT